MLTLEDIQSNIPSLEIRANEPMREHTSFKVGGPARFFVEPATASELEALLSLCKAQGENCAVIGRGSNLLVSDAGFDGVVICLGEHFGKTVVSADGFEASAGASLVGIAAVARRAGLTGLEFASGIPGSLGGAIIMNAGAYGGEMKDIVEAVTVLTKDGEIKEFSGDEMKFRYRGSLAMDEGYIVLGAKLHLEKGDKKAIGERMNELMTSRRTKQPIEYPSAGSTFKRPEGYFAGKLIEDAGLRGYQIGGAQVSEKHCGFIINKDSATADDIVRLCDYVADKVEEMSGVRLEMEVRKLGF